MHLSNKISLCRFLYKEPISPRAKFYGEFYNTGKQFHLYDNFQHFFFPCAFTCLSKMLCLVMFKSLKTHSTQHFGSTQPRSGTGIAYRSHLHEFWVRSLCDINEGECSVSLAGSITLLRGHLGITVPGKTASVTRGN